MAMTIYALRMQEKTQQDIAALAAIYGAPNGRAFAREILEVVTSGDMEKIKAFNARLVRGMGQQMTLRLNAAADEAVREMEGMHQAATAAAVAKVVKRKAGKRPKRRLRR